MSACSSGWKIVIGLNSPIALNQSSTFNSMSQRPWGLVVREGKLLISTRQDPVGALVSKSQPNSIKVLAIKYFISQLPL
jgi:hypothetical protein